MRLSDDELTALLAEHRICDSHCGRHCRKCQSFQSNAWPCETWRLATEVRELRRDAKWNVYVAFADWHPGFAAFKEGWDLVPDDKAWRPKGALDRYEEGGSP